MMPPAPLRRGARARRQAAELVDEHADAAERLLEFAAEQDLLVVGIHGHSRAGGIMVGSAATAALHRSPIPVLVARRPPEGVEFPARIVLASDGTPISDAAVELTARLAGAPRFAVGTIVGARDREAPFRPGLAEHAAQIIEAHRHRAGHPRRAGRSAPRRRRRRARLRRLAGRHRQPRSVRPRRAAQRVRADRPCRALLSARGPADDHRDRDEVGRTTSPRARATMRELLGGKGAGIAEMTRVLGPELVPAGFTITTEACVAYMRDGEVPDGFGDAVDAAIARLEAQAGRRLGDPADPLLVSVRSGARDSMPGMMDTVLNLGLNDESVAGLAEATGNRALRLGLLPAPGADVRRRGLRRARASASRTRSPRSRPSAACASTPSSTSTR